MAGASQQDGVPETKRQRRSRLRRQEHREQLAAQAREQLTQPLAADSRGGHRPESMETKP